MRRFAAGVMGAIGLCSDGHGKTLKVQACWIAEHDPVVSISA